MSRLQSPLPAHAEATTCGAMLQELQNLWDEMGESDIERDKMILQLEQECLDIYRKKVEHARKQKADLHQALAEAEAEASNLILALGEHESFSRFEKPKGTLKEQTAVVKPALEELRLKRGERMKNFLEIQSNIFQIHAEISGNTLGNVSCHQVDERDLSLRRLGELKSQLQELQKDKNHRLQEVNHYVKLIHEMSIVMSIDFKKAISEDHPSFLDSTNGQPKSISNDTLARLAGSLHMLGQEKKQRLQKLQGLGSTLIELWNLMDTSLDEQKKFKHVTCLISASVDELLEQGCLSLDVIEQTEMEVERLNVLKASKMKELVLKKQIELEAIYRGVHIDVDGDAARQALFSVIESGKVDLSELLLGMEDQIAHAKDHALSRKDILDKVEKWTFASEEESWLDEYERDQNRYNAGRGSHKNLKRAEKARILVSKISSIVENLITKIKAWEKETGTLFIYDKVRLLESLEEYSLLRHQREEDKRRSRENKKLQEQLTAEQEVLFGSKPSPMRQFPAKKPLGQSSNINMAVGTPNNRRVSTPLGRHGVSSLGKVKRDIGKPSTMTPVNYVALSKDDSFSHNVSVVSP
uniref:65-kDa microtubule-associated protein 5 n=1 Tax=Anthurium amnicola TaxID=1678845 RepID=A0A1D1ZGR6_9ARAE